MLLGVSGARKSEKVSTLVAQSAKGGGVFLLSHSRSGFGHELSTHICGFVSLLP